jgi:hypothetical protein
MRRLLLLLRVQDPFHDIDATATLYLAVKDWMRIPILRGLTPEGAASVWSL